MNEVAELSVEVEGTHLSVAQELALNVKPRGKGDCTTARADNLHQLGGNHVVDPREHDKIHVVPSRDVGVRHVRDEP